MAVRANVRPEDWTVMRVQRASSTSPATGYVNESDLLPRLTKADGTRIIPPRSYTLDSPAADPQDPVGLATMTCTRPASGETHVLGIGRRNAHPHAWTFTGDGFTDVPVVAYIDGMSVSEFTFQRLGDTDRQFYDNPTMQGGVVDFPSIGDVGGGTAGLLEPSVYCPAPQFHLDLHPGDDGEGYYRGATRPIHYSAGGRPAAAGNDNDHGEDEDEVAIFWDQIQYQEIKVNVGDRARLHGVTGWSYQRREWFGTEAPPFRDTFGANSITIIERPLGNRFDTYEVFDLDNLDSGAKYDKSAVIAGRGINNETIGIVALGSSLYTFPHGGDFLSIEPQVSASGRVAMAVSDSDTGFCVAWAAKLNVDPNPFDHCVTPSSMVMQVPLFDWYDGYTHPQAFAHTGPYFQTNSSDDRGRASGWIGARSLMFIGHRDNLPAALAQITDDGLLDEAVPEPPEAVRVGTEWPPQADPGFITADLFDDTIETDDGTGDIDICNMALANLGVSEQIDSITSFEDTDVAAKLCARFYPRVRDALLERRNWSFALKRAELVELQDTATTAWNYCYAQPTDLLRLLGVHLENDTDDLCPREAVQEVVAGTKAILTDVPPGAWVRYTARVTDTTQFSPLFIECASWFLAERLAGPMTNDMRRAAYCRERALELLGEASKSDAGQRRIRPQQHKYPWVR